MYQDPGYRLALILIGFLFLLRIKQHESSVESAKIIYPSKRSPIINGKFSIHVFGWRRRRSIERLCNSLLEANYENYEIPLNFHIDGEPLESVVSYVQSFHWPFGSKTIDISPIRRGMPAAIVERWIPSANDEFALFLEDDVAVSKAFLSWCIFCIDRMVSSDNPGLIGCSLYTPIVNEIGPAPNPWSPPRWSAAKTVGRDSKWFYFQLPCSWGGLYYSEYWREFLEYYQCRKDFVTEPEIPNSRSNEWFKSWKRMLIELMVARNWYLIYPNFPDSASFSTNFFEMGIHSQPDSTNVYYPDSLRSKGDYRFTVPLLDHFDLPQHQKSALPVWVNLQHQKVTGQSDFILNPKALEALKAQMSVCL